MVKLVIQIPCYNEEQCLASTLRGIPRKIAGIDKIEILLINDGSTDRSVEIAKENNVDEILNLSHVGLSKAFAFGLRQSLSMGGDVIVNFDADNQYKAEDIEKLVKPIVCSEADVVFGVRNIISNSSFSVWKKFLQVFGSFIVRLLTGSKVRDIPTGFRAFSREAAERLNVYNSYTYTVESVFQMEAEKMKIASVKIQTTDYDCRESRLMKNVGDYVLHQAGVILCMFTYYHPVKAAFLFTLLGYLLSAFVLFSFSEAMGWFSLTIVYLLILFWVIIMIKLIRMTIGTLQENKRDK